MFKQVTAAFLLLTQVGIAEDAKLSGRKLKINKVSKEAYSVAKGIDEAKKGNITVVFEKTVTQEGFTAFMKKNSWATKVTVAYGNANIGSLAGLEKAKDLKELTLKSLKKSKDKAIDLAPLKGKKKLEKVNFYATKVSNTEALSKCVALKDISFYMSNVSSIEFLRGTPAVEKLDLYGFGHSFENYDPVAGLKNLKDLNVYMNEQAVDEKLKVLSKLSSLETFSFANCKHITTLDFLENCTGLKELEGKWAKGIVDVSVLSKLNQLEEVELTDCAVSDFSALKNCPNLEDIDVSGTKIENIDFVKGLNKLKELDINETGIKSLAAIKKHATLSRLDISKTEITEIKDAATLPKLRYINVKKTKVSNLKPLLKCEKLRTIKLDKDVHAKFMEQTKKDYPKINMY